MKPNCSVRCTRIQKLLPMLHYSAEFGGALQYDTFKNISAIYNSEQDTINWDFLGQTIEFDVPPRAQGGGGGARLGCLGGLGKTVLPVVV